MDSPSELTAINQFRGNNLNDWLTRISDPALSESEFQATIIQAVCDVSKPQSFAILHESSDGLSVVAYSQDQYEDSILRITSGASADDSDTDDMPSRADRYSVDGRELDNRFVGLWCYHPRFRDCLSYIINTNDTCDFKLDGWPNQPTNSEASVAPWSEEWDSPNLNMLKEGLEQCHIIFVPMALKSHDHVVFCAEVTVQDNAEMNGLKNRLTAIGITTQLRITLDANHDFESFVHQLDDENSSLKQTIAELNDGMSAKDRLAKALKFGQSVSGTLEKEKNGFVIANELQSYLPCDRATIVETIGRKSKVLAVSGQPDFDKRSNIVRVTQKLASALLSTGEQFWFDGEIENLPPSLRETIQSYLDESLAQSFVLIPLLESTPQRYLSREQSLVEVVNPGQTDTKKVRGGVLIENFSYPFERDKIEATWEPVAQQIANQFVNSKRFSDLLFLPLWQKLTGFFAFYRGHTRRIALGITAAVVAVVALGILIPSEFRIRCEGYLRPEQLHHVFIVQPGIVEQVHVQDGQLVEADEVLIRIKDPGLELEMVNLEGQLNEKLSEETQIIHRRSTLSSTTTAPNRATDEYHRLARQNQLLSVEIEAIRRQIMLKQDQLDDLVIRAPCSGTIMGWNVDRKYLHRPVEEGTLLFSIAPSEGDHQLELKVSDKRSGYVQSAYFESLKADKSLRVEFTLASFPGQQYLGQVRKVNPGLEQDTDLGYILPVEVELTSELPPNVRSGLPVIAKIACGKKSFIYCKSYEFVDWMRRTVFEYSL